MGREPAGGRWEAGVRDEDAVQGQRRTGEVLSRGAETRSESAGALGSRKEGFLGSQWGGSTAARIFLGALKGRQPVPLLWNMRGFPWLWKQNRNSCGEQGGEPGALQWGPRTTRGKR